jgi:hypothetical protein
MFIILSLHCLPSFRPHGIHHRLQHHRRVGAHEPRRALGVSSAAGAKEVHLLFLCPGLEGFRV